MAAKTTPQDKDVPKAKDDQDPVTKNDQAPEASPAPDAPSSGDGQAGANGASGKTGAESDDPAPSEPRPEEQQYRVTGRTDVLHNGELYAEGDSLWLNQVDAYPLLKAGCIQPVGW